MKSKKIRLVNFQKFGQVKIIPEDQMDRAAIYKVNGGIVVIALYLADVLAIPISDKFVYTTECSFYKKSLGYHQKWEIFIQEILDLFPLGTFLQMRLFHFCL